MHHMKPASSPAAAVAPHHGVKFYGSEASLFETVAEFIGDGLLDGQPAIMLVSAAHRAGMLAQIAARGIDVAAMRRAGTLTVLEAEEILPLLMVDGIPDPERFDQHVARVVERHLRAYPNGVARAYGELVDLLWQAGQANAAITLEMFWNRLGLKHRFSLLCGYSMGHFYKNSGGINEIISQHAHVHADSTTASLPALA